MGLIKDAIGYEEPTNFEHSCKLNPELTPGLQVSDAQKKAFEILVNPNMNATEGMSQTEIQKKGREFIEEISNNK